MKSGTKRKAKTLIFLTVAVIVLGNAAPILSNHFREMSPEEQLLRSSYEEIKEHLLNEMPYGMSMEDTIKTIKEHNEWILDAYDISYEHGTHFGAGIGEKSIRACIGKYKEFGFLLGMTSVVVWWAYDEDEKLIAILVNKETDAP